MARINENGIPKKKMKNLSNEKLDLFSEFIKIKQIKSNYFLNNQAIEFTTNILRLSLYTLFQ